MDFRQQIESKLYSAGLTYEADASGIKVWPKNLFSISHGIVNNHKGKLLFETVEGKYTKVMVDLPIHAVQS